MKKNLLISIIASSFLIAPLSHAQGTGVRGGGQTVDVNGRPSLRDLVDKTNCYYVSASDFVKTLPEFQGIMDSLEKANWYLRYNIEENIKTLQVCKTESALKKISVEDDDAVTVALNAGGEQVGVRLNNQIFLDMNLFNAQTPVAQAYTMVHEVMHSFIPMNEQLRNNRVRSMVAAIHLNQAKPMSTADFALQMDANHLTIHPMIELMSNPSGLQEFTQIMDNQSTELERIAALGQLRKSAEGKFSAKSFTADHQKILNQVSQAGAAAILSAVQKGDTEQALILLKADANLANTNYSFAQMYSDRQTDIVSEALTVLLHTGKSVELPTYSLLKFDVRLSKEVWTVRIGRHEKRDMNSLAERAFLDRNDLLAIKLIEAMDEQSPLLTSVRTYFVESLGTRVFMYSANINGLAYILGWPASSEFAKKSPLIVKLQ